MSDSEFIREVDEEVRREKLKQFWDKYGFYIAGCALAIVATVAGIKGWDYWKTSRAQEAGAKFVNAEVLMEEGKKSAADEIYKELEAKGPGGYPLLARLRLAGNEAASGKKDDAVAAYDAIAREGGADRLLKGFAQISAAFLRVDDAKFEEIKDRVQALNTPDDPWRHSARELLGLSAYNAGKYDTAKEYFTEILGDQNAPQNMRQRAEMMLSLIVGASASKNADESASEKTAEEKPAEKEEPKK